MKCKNCKNLKTVLDADGHLFKWCDEICDCPHEDMERDCKHYAKTSNADRIRAMSDEELALFINSIVTYDYTAYRRIEGKMIEADTLDWLKQEVT